MKTNTKTFQFRGVVTVLLGLNLLILGKAMAQVQTASLEIEPGNLTLAVPSSISFEKKILTKDAPLTENIILDPFDNRQTIQVMDPVTGNTFHVNLTFKNMSGSHQENIQEDPNQDVPPFIGGGQPVTIHVKDVSRYFINDTITVGPSTAGNNEHMRVLSVDPESNTITVLRGVDNTDDYASTTDPIPRGIGFTAVHIVPFDQFKVITLHGNGNSDSVDTGSTNEPLGTNNVSSPISYYFNPDSSTAADYPDANLTSFPTDSAPGSDPTAVNAASAPVTLMERTVDTPSYGIYSVGMLLRANIPAGNPYGDFSGELTFSLEP